MAPTSPSDGRQSGANKEGDHLAGPDWLRMLAAIGIIKGQPFTPDAHTRETLDRAAKTGYKTSRAIGEKRYYVHCSLV